MAGKREKPEDIVSKLRQVEVLQGQGATVAEAVRQIGVTQQTFYRWRKLYGGMQRSQLVRLKELEKENQRPRRAMSGRMRYVFCTDAGRLFMGNCGCIQHVAGPLARRGVRQEH